MANFQQIMQDEIRRLARKEVKPDFEALQSRLVEQRKTILELQKRIKALEKAAATNVPVSATAEAEAPAEEAAPAIRLSPARIVKLRTKLNLNQSQFAALLEVSPLSVRQWELGNTVPRAAQKAKIASFRSIGKRELLSRLASLGITPGKRTKRQAPAETPETPEAPAEAQQ